MHRYGKCYNSLNSKPIKEKKQKSIEGSNQFCKGRQLDCLPLQNLLLPFNKLVRQYNKSRVCFLFLSLINY